jgi:hypothetical protein
MSLLGDEEIFGKKKKKRDIPVEGVAVNCTLC